MRRGKADGKCAVAVCADTSFSSYKISSTTILLIGNNSVATFSQELTFEMIMPLKKKIDAGFSVKKESNQLLSITYVCR